jgi:ubiquinone/menaquinone biosynthesis C-methylase UbiE
LYLAHDGNLLTVTDDFDQNPSCRYFYNFHREPIMNTKQSIAKAYDCAANEYAAALWNELDKKPFDQIFLNWFATQIPPGETLLEIGSGPGEVSGYLSHQGVNCLGTDISEQMIENGKKYFPQVKFETQDYFHLSYADKSFCGVIGYYAIVNLTPNEVELVLAEVKRVLREGGIFVFTFHIYEGEEKVDVASFFNQESNQLTFYYFKVDDVKAMVENTGYQVQDILIRYPYKDAEYQSKRAYFVVRKP